MSLKICMYMYNKLSSQWDLIIETIIFRQSGIHFNSPHLNMALLGHSKRLILAVALLKKSFYINPVFKIYCKKSVLKKKDKKKNRS